MPTKKTTRPQKIENAAVKSSSKNPPKNNIKQYYSTYS